MDGLSPSRKVKMAKAFLAVAAMKPGMKWAEARSDNRLRSRDVIRWMNEYLGEDISSGSYDDIRRKDLLLPVEAGLVQKSAGNDAAATNDGTRTHGRNSCCSKDIVRRGNIPLRQFSAPGQTAPPS